VLGSSTSYIQSKTKKGGALISINAMTGLNPFTFFLCAKARHQTKKKKKSLEVVSPLAV